MNVRCPTCLQTDGIIINDKEWHGYYTIWCVCCGETFFIKEEEMSLPDTNVKTSQFFDVNTKSFKKK